MAILNYQVNDRVRKAAGEAVRSQHGAASNDIRIERAPTLLRSNSDAWLAPGTPDTELTNCLLIQQQDLGGDQQHLNLYRVYLSNLTPAEQASVGYCQINEPTEDRNFTQLIWRFRVKWSEYGGASAPAGSLGDACPIPGYTSLKQVVRDSVAPLDGLGVFAQVTRIFESIPDTVVEYRTMQYSFPALLDNITASKTDVDRRDSAFRIYVSKRPEITVPVEAKVTTSYHLCADAAAVDALRVPAEKPIEIKPNIIQFSGEFFSFSTGQVLNDDYSTTGLAYTGRLFYTDDDGEDFYETIEGEIKFAASVPSKSVYQSWIGTEKIINRDIQRWRGNIYAKQLTSITMQ